MTATTEISVEKVIKTIKNLPPGNNDAASEKLKQNFEDIQYILIEYFNKHSQNSWEESLTDLYEVILNFKFASIPLLKDNIDFNDAIKDDNHINNNIIDVFQNTSIPLQNLNLSVIQTLELIRDNTTASDVSKIPSDLNGMLQVLSDSKESNLIKTISDEFRKDNLTTDLVDAKRVFFSALSIDLVSLVYILIDDKKLIFDSNKLTELIKFNTNALAVYNDGIEKIALLKRMAETIMDLTAFVMQGKAGISFLQKASEAIYKVFELKNLEAGWDDEESLPIKTQHIESGMDIISLMFKRNQSIPSFIAPTVYSGVLLEYAGSEDRIDIRIGDEDFVFFNYFKSKKLIGKRIPFSLDNINEITWKSQQAI